MKAALGLLVAATTLAATPLFADDLFQLIQNDGTAAQVHAAIQHGADVNAPEDGDGYLTSIQMAAMDTSDPGVIQELARAGAAVNEAGEGKKTPLMIAASSNPNSEVFAALFAAGAQVEARSDSQQTALMEASGFNKNPAVIAELLKAGAQVNDKDSIGMTALMTAAFHDADPEVASLLLKDGAAVNDRDSDGENALIIAADHTTKPPFITLLLQARADARVKDSHLKNAFGYARFNDSLKGTSQLQALEDAQKEAFEPVTAANWTTHPRIVAIRKMVADVEAMVKAGAPKEKDHTQANTDPTADTYRQAFTDAHDVIRKFVRSAGPPDDSTLWTYYYDLNGNMLFAYLQATVPNGTHMQDRIYFDELRHRLWEVQKVLDGPGSDFPDPWPTGDIVFYPSRWSLDEW